MTIVGRSVAGKIVCTPPPGMLNSIVCGPATAFAAVIACRNEPAPESSVLVTVKVAPGRKAETPEARARTRHVRPIEDLRIGDSFVERPGDGGSLCRSGMAGRTT